MATSRRSMASPGSSISPLIVRLLAAALCTLALLGPAGADPNELGGGVLVAHYVAAIAFSHAPPPEGWCGAYAPYAIDGLDEVVAQIDGEEVPAVWYVLVAWNTGEKTWCGTEFGFGEYDPAGFAFEQWGACYPALGLEIPAAAWPGPGQGTAFVTTGTPWTGNWVPVYSFAGYAAVGAGVQTSIPLSVDPPTGSAAVSNCQNPPQTFPFDETHRGALGINQLGVVPEFDPPLQAVCCLPTGTCLIMPEASCLTAGGEWLWWLTSCVPNPCHGTPSVCCLDDGTCLLTEEEWACTVQGGVWHPEWYSCDPNPCPQPTVCCLGGDCAIVHSAQACSDLGGVHHPEWSDCAPNPCPAVCCLATGTCLLLGEDDCVRQGGTRHPDLMSCDPNPCDVPPGQHNLEGGALLVHHVPALAYSTDPPPGGWCEAYETYAIHGLDELITRIDVQASAPATWYVLAAWESGTKRWCGVEFGLGGFDPGLFNFAEAEGCFPSGGLEIPTGGWPGPGEGTAIVTTGTPWVGNWQPVYFFGGYAYGGPGQIPIDVDPAGGEILLSNCANPPRTFPVEEERRGMLGVNTEGYPPSGPSNQKVCCLPSGECRITGITECDLLGGSWYAQWTSCEPNPCPQPAVCCVQGACILVYSPEECDAHSGGVYHPEWVSCDPNPCPPAMYVCCFDDGSCQVLTQSTCTQTGGHWRPNLGVSCTPNPCPQPRVCCVYNECRLEISSSACLSHPGGVWHPEWLSCDPNPCPQEGYVCCLDGGACLVLPEPECLQAGGAWMPQWGRSCVPNRCPQEARVCCLEGNACELLTQAACAQAGGQWRPDLGDSCDPNPCAGSTGPHNLAEGALLAHHVPELAYSTQPPGGGWCEAYQTYAVTGFDDLITRIDVPGQLAATWFVLAAWDGEDKIWCGVEFGLDDFDQGLFAFHEAAPCYPAGSSGLELPSSGWPGPNQGTALVTTGAPWEGNWEPVYFFAGYAYGYGAPGQIPLAVDPTTDFIGFSNCQVPPQVFAVAQARRGALGINTDGYPPSGAANERACCLPELECYVTTQYACALLGGIWHPEWTGCEPNPCQPEPYVCCFDEGECQVLLEEDCISAGGRWRPELGRTCDPNPCPHPSICCVYGECLVVFTPDECYAHPGGTYYPMWESCDPNPCPQESYVCCLPSGACVIRTQAACQQAGGQWRPDLGQSCSPNPCLEGRAVCCVGYDCFLMLQSECENAQGIWWPEWTSCEPNPCEFAVPVGQTSWGRIKVLFR